MVSLRKGKWLAALAACSISTAGLAEQSPLQPADALTMKIDTSDANRFADLWKKSGGQPTAAQLEEYIRCGGEGVKIFIPYRIKDAANMQTKIAAHRDWYEQAIGKCLAWVPSANPDLRAIYLAMRGLLPEKPLPQIYMVIGGANTGGTTGPGAQVLGLEILCRDGPTPEKFRELLRTFFAHETAHTFQRPREDDIQLREPLLSQILVEGAADYIAGIVTGATPNEAREAYGRAHEAELWTQFVRDRTIANRSYSKDKGYAPMGEQAFAHWLYNGAKGKLSGWETDMGYWLGMQIAKAYVERAADPHAAIREVLALEDPAEILRKSGYGDKFKR